MKTFNMFVNSLFVLIFIGVHLPVSAGCNCPRPSAEDIRNGSGGMEGARNRCHCRPPTAQEKLNGSGGAEGARYGSRR